MKLFTRRRNDRARMLVAEVCLSSWATAGGLEYKPYSGFLGALCFARPDTFEHFGCAPDYRPPEGSYYVDKFIRFEAGNTARALGLAVVKEVYVYDGHHRSEIDRLGVAIDLTLRPSAFEQYLDFIGQCDASVKTAEPGRWDGGMLLHLPAPIFSWPRLRSSPTPYPPPGRHGKVGKLRTIKRFRFDTISMFKTRRGHRLEYGYQAGLTSLPSRDVLHLR